MLGLEEAIAEFLSEEIQAWRAQAACRGKGHRIFFPERGGEWEEAMAICAPCPVKTQCADWALRHERFGIWGGTSERERRRIAHDQDIRRSRIDVLAETTAAGRGSGLQQRVHSR